MTRYTGTRLPTADDQDLHGRPLQPYLPEPELVEAVNLAMVLQRPLLLRGEPGCGKTRLAEMVAWELGLPYWEWHVKSTSRAEEGLYTFDAVGRLRDAQLAAIGKGGEEQSPAAYLRFGPLGEAFRQPGGAVLLIDEIDKADPDFPNDLLLELDQMRFDIRETGETIVAQQRPLIFITSNDERELSDAFLRRCLFHYIDFPTPERMWQILQARFGAAEVEGLQPAQESFAKLRQRMTEDATSRTKNVGLGELIDWFTVLIQDLDGGRRKACEGHYPHPSVLVKRAEDRRYLEPR